MEKEKVLPACAGVIPVDCKIGLEMLSFTRMRGGDPAIRKRDTRVNKFYPHARG